MLSLNLRELSENVRSISTRRRRSPGSSDIETLRELTTAWFLRLWFLGQLNPQWVDDIELSLSQEDQSYHFFQAIRLIFERGIHEPSERHRQVAKKIISSLNYCGPTLESESWWEPTLHFFLDKQQTNRLIALAKNTERDAIYALFPQISSEHFDSDQTLVSAEINALRAKLFLNALKHQPPWPSLNTLVQLDPGLIYQQSQFPPENQTREYKSTFRWDSTSKQKNSNQTLACLKTICGFLNSEGGTLVIGVTDNGEVIGLNGDFSLIQSQNPHDAFVQLFHETIKQNIKPIPIALIKLHFAPYGSNEIAIAQVQSSLITHQLRSKGEDWQLYVRDGNRTLHLMGFDAENFMSSRNSR